LWLCFFAFSATIGSASLPGDSWLLIPVMTKEALLLIPNLLQALQTIATDVRNAGHTHLNLEEMPFFVKKGIRFSQFEYR